MKELEKYNITKEGSLGLLALGAKGLLAWREFIKQESGENEDAEG